jgi:hypothetical protein
MPLNERAGSGIEWYGSEDPDPYKYITDPEHCRGKTLVAPTTTHRLKLGRTQTTAYAYKIKDLAV